MSGLNIKFKDGVASVLGSSIESKLPEGITLDTLKVVDELRSNHGAEVIGAVHEEAVSKGLSSYTTKPISLGGNTTMVAAMSNGATVIEYKTTHTDAMASLVTKLDDYANKTLAAMEQETLSPDDKENLAANAA